jgi:magnesium transporter
MDLQGLGSEAILKQVGDIFHLHPLLLEDVVNVPQRAKVDDYQKQLLVLAHMVRLKRDKPGFETEQVSFILGKKYLLTVQEEELEDCFDPVRNSIRTNQGKIRQAGADYLLYMLLDVLIDSYFPVLEHYEDRIEELEDAILLNPSENLMEELYGVRRELLALRRLLWPMQNVLNTIIRGDYKLIDGEVQIYFRDCYDHVIQLMDILETYRELTASLMELYLNSISNRMNEVMKLLTAVSTIFIPLTFIAGVYGMNFENMPELRERWGYYGALGLMGTIAASLVYFFWSRGWFAQSYSSKRLKKICNKDEK